MTRKDYNLIASTLLAAKPTLDTESGEAICKRTEAQIAIWEEVVVRMSCALASTNLRFDGERFKAACHGQ